MARSKKINPNDLNNKDIDVEVKSKKKVRKKTIIKQQLDKIDSKFIDFVKKYKLMNKVKVKPFDTDNEIINEEFVLSQLEDALSNFLKMKEKEEIIIVPDIEIAEKVYTEAGYSPKKVFILILPNITREILLGEDNLHNDELLVEKIKGLVYNFTEDITISIRRV